MWEMLRTGLLFAPSSPETSTTPGRTVRTASGVPAPLTVFTFDTTRIAALFGRHSTFAGLPAGGGVLLMSITFSVPQIDELRPAGQPSKVLNSRSSIATFPDTRRTPLARTCL